MLRSYIFYRFIRLTFLTAFVLSLILLSLQLSRLSSVLMGLPLEDVGGFILLWVVFYTYFFLPDGVILATAGILMSLKENRLLHVFYSFRISNLRLFSFFLTGFLVVFLILGGFSWTLIEEKVAFVRKNLIFKYQDKLFSELPVNTFIRFGGMVVHVQERRGSELKGVFFKFGDLIILAESLKYEGSGVFVFKKGTVFTEEEGKPLLLRFKEYTLNVRQFYKKELRENRVRESIMVNYVNTAVSIPLFLFSFWFCLFRCSRMTRFYLFVALGIIFHQFVIFLVKTVF